MAFPDIRAAGPEDAAAVTAILSTVWRESYLGMIDTDYLQGRMGDDVAALTAAMLAPNSAALVLLAVRQGRALGVLTAQQEADDPACERLSAISVLPEARGKGLGTALIGVAAVRQAALGRERAVLTVLPGNLRARALYARLGGTEEAGFVSAALPGGGETAGLAVRWSDIKALAQAARTAFRDSA
ncbi:MAG: GNAT family N-acetyltransferase, partial [Pseudomonadota bacterium]